MTLAEVGPDIMFTSQDPELFWTVKNESFVAGLVELISTRPLESILNRSVAAVANLSARSLWRYWIYPSYSPDPVVASEKKRLPLFELPLRIVIPHSPESAIVKLSAVPFPSVVVPKSIRPEVSSRAFSWPPTESKISSLERMPVWLREPPEIKSAADPKKCLSLPLFLILIEPPFEWVLLSRSSVDAVPEIFAEPSTSSESHCSSPVISTPSDLVLSFSTLWYLRLTALLALTWKAVLTVLPFCCWRLISFHSLFPVCLMFTSPVLDW